MSNIVREWTRQKPENENEQNHLSRGFADGTICGCHLYEFKDKYSCQSHLLSIKANEHETKNIAKDDSILIDDLIKYLESLRMK